MEADTVHQLVHNEGGTRHISRILHKRNAEIQNEYVRQKHYHPADSADNAVCHHILKRPVVHKLVDNIAEPPYRALYPFHRVLPEHKCGPEYEEHY